MPNKIIRATVCGSFHKDLEGLSKLILMLQRSGVQVLSPRSLEFSDCNHEFKVLKYEAFIEPPEIERWHLHAIANSDLVWVHCPDGYVGVSVAFEIGFAHALGKRVYSLEEPSDLVFKTIVIRKPDVFTDI